MATLAYFGINSSGLTTAIDLVIVFAIVLYLSLIYWTFADARRRISDPMLIGCATAASFFPFVGTIIYMVLRPPEYLEDVRERELEVQAAEARLYQLDYELCPHCDYRIERDFIRCPSCLRKLKDRCTSCSKPLDRAWTICPYCETEVPMAGSPSRARRRRSASGPETQAARERTSTAVAGTTKGRSSSRAALPRSTSEATPQLEQSSDMGEDPDTEQQSGDVALPREERETEPTATRPRGASRSSRPRPAP
jgi:hypothetical protein